MAMAEVGATHGKGRREAGWRCREVDRAGRDGVPRLVRGRRARPCAPTRWATCSPAARAVTRRAPPSCSAATSTASPPAASSTARLGCDRRARGDAHARTSWASSDRGPRRAGELDRRGGRPLRQGHDGLRRLVGRLRPRPRRRRCVDPDGIRLGDALDADRCCAARTPAARLPRPTAISSCTSSRARSWSARGCKTIGIVTGGQAQIWYDAVVTGQRQPRRHHPARPPGGTRWSARRASSTWWTARCVRAAKLGRGTVGQLFVVPEQPQRDPGRGHGSRSNSATRTRPSCPASPPSSRATPASSPATPDVTLELTERVRLPAQPFDPACVALVRDAAARLGYPGAGDRVRRRSRRDLRGAVGAELR